MSKYKKVNEYGYVGREKTGHKVCTPGKRVIVTMRDDTKFVDKFKLREGRFHYFYERGRIKSNAIRSLSVVTANFKAEQIKVSP